MCDVCCILCCQCAFIDPFLGYLFLRLQYDVPAAGIYPGLVHLGQDSESSCLMSGAPVQCRSYVTSERLLSKKLQLQKSQIHCLLKFFHTDTYKSQRGRDTWWGAEIGGGVEEAQGGS